MRARSCPRCASALLVTVTAALGACAQAVNRPPVPTSPAGMGQARIDAITNDPETESNLRASPDGQRLLFNLTSGRGRSGLLFGRPAVSSNYRETAIAMIELGSPGKSIVSPAGARDPAWFPDGRRFAFSILQGEQAMLATSTIGAETSAIEFVSPTPCVAYDWQPSVSRDGKTLLFTTFSPSAQHTLATMELASSTTKCKLLFPGEGAQWSPVGGRRFLFTRSVNTNDQIFVFEEEGNKLTQVTFGDHDNNSPSWSPDGNRIAFVSNRNGDPDLYVIGRDGTGLVQITHGPTLDGSPTWAADGRIYFVSNAGGQIDIWRAQF